MRSLLLALALVEGACYLIVGASRLIVAFLLSLTSGEQVEKREPFERP